jgi:hypothetical protein
LLPHQRRRRTRTRTIGEGSPTPALSMYHDTKFGADIIKASLLYISPKRENLEGAR